MSAPRFWAVLIEYEFASPDDAPFDASTVVGVYTSLQSAQDAAQAVIEGEIKWCDVDEDDPYHQEEYNVCEGMLYKNQRVWFVRIDGFVLDEVPLETVGQI